MLFLDNVGSGISDSPSTVKVSAPDDNLIHALFEFKKNRVLLSLCGDLTFS